MAAITSTALAVGMAGYQVYQGQKQKRDAKEALDSYKRQDLDNAFQDVRVSTIGSELMREESQRTAANLTDAVRQGGARSILSSIPKITSLTNDSNREARAYLDDQEVRRQYSIAGDKVNTRGMQERREEGDLAGLGQAMMTGDQNMWSGIRGLGAGMRYGAQNIDFGGTEGVTDENGQPVLGDDGKQLRMRSGSYLDQQQRKQYKYYMSNN